MDSIIIRSVVFIGVPGFPIAVERVFSKRLRCRPVVLVQTDSPRSRCMVVSSEAQEFGVKAGMLLNIARRHCRDLSVILPDPSLYNRAVEAIRHVLSDFTPLCETVRPGQSYLDLTGCRRLLGDPLTVAQRIRTIIRNELRLPADAGIAGNKLVSRVAAIDANPEGLLEVEHGCEEPFLAPHRVSVLPAADKKMRDQLVELNILLVQQIKEIDYDTLISALGPTAIPLSKQSRGIDPTPVLPPSKPPQITVSEELKDDTNDPELIEGYIRKLILEGTSLLKRKRYASGSLNLRLTYSDGRIASGNSQLRYPTNYGSVWLSEANTLFRRIRSRRTRIRAVDLIFTRLTQSAVQLMLWDKLSVEFEDSFLTGHLNESSRQHSRLTKSLEALETIRKRYGEASLQLGSVV